MASYSNYSHFITITAREAINYLKSEETCGEVYIKSGYRWVGLEGRSWVSEELGLSYEGDNKDTQVYHLDESELNLRVSGNELIYHINELKKRVDKLEDSL